VCGPDHEIKKATMQNVYTAWQVCQRVRHTHTLKYNTWKRLLDTKYPVPTAESEAKMTLRVSVPTPVQQETTTVNVNF